MPDKAERVHNYHRNTVHALAELIAAMGLDHTSELSPHHAVRRVASSSPRTGRDLDFVKPGELLDGTALPRFQGFWDQASAESLPPLVRLRARRRLSGTQTGMRDAAVHGTRDDHAD